MVGGELVVSWPVSCCAPSPRSSPPPGPPLPSSPPGPPIPPVITVSHAKSTYDLGLYFFMKCCRVLLTFLDRAIPEPAVHRLLVLHHIWHLLHLKRVHQQGRQRGRKLRSRVRSLLRHNHLHLRVKDLDQHNLHQEPGLPLLLHPLHHCFLCLHRQQGIWIMWMFRLLCFGAAGMPFCLPCPILEKFFWFMAQPAMRLSPRFVSTFFALICFNLSPLQQGVG